MTRTTSTPFATAAALVLLAACGGGGADATAAPPAPAASQADPTLTRSVLLGNLQNPWDLAFAADGTMFFTERARGVSVRRPDGRVTRVLAPPADFIAAGQSGFAGIALDPEFERNRRVYVFFSSNAGGTPDNRVARFTVDSGYTALADRTDIVTGISYKARPSAGAPMGTGAHNGGRLRFGPDGMLWITTGDNHNGLIPQAPTELGGKVLRVDRDGKAAPDNRAPAAFDKRIYAYGFRNPQGIAFRPGSGVAYIAEHGPGHTDEVTALANGGNGGWDPVCQDGVSYCGYGSNQASGLPTPMTDTTKFPQALRPAWNNGGRSQGMAGADFLRGAQWKGWDGAFAVAFMSGTRIEVLKLDAAGNVTATVRQFDALGARIRAVVQGPDGALYLTTDGKMGGDEVWRVVGS